MKAVKEKLSTTNPDRVAAFEKGAQGFAKKIVANFKDYEFVRVRLVNYPDSPLTKYPTVHWRGHEP